MKSYFDIFDTKNDYDDSKKDLYVSNVSVCMDTDEVYYSKQLPLTYKASQQITVDESNFSSTINYGTYDEETEEGSIVFDKNLIEIGDEAFADMTEIESITIPETVESIGENAFNGCSGLTEVVMNPTTPPEIGEGAFDNTNDCDIIVPLESKEAYKESWSEYAEQITTE